MPSGSLHLAKTDFLNCLPSFLGHVFYFDLVVLCAFAVDISFRFCVFPGFTPFFHNIANAIDEQRRERDDPLFVQKSQTEEAPERAKRLSPISRLCLIFYNIFPLLNLQFS